VSGRPKILIVDDEKRICESCAGVLLGDGWKTESRYDGESGSAAYAEVRPDVVLLDLKLPDGDGLSVLERIRERDGDAVVVVITGYATIQSAVNSIKRGAFDFLPKPFTPDELRIIARRALDRRRLLTEAERLRRDQQRMRDHFIAMVSHQLRTPLVAVRQYHEVLLEGLAGEMSGEQRDIVIRSGKRIDELLRLIRDWLTLSRLDEQSVRERSEDFDLVPLLGEILELAAPAAAEREVTFTLPEEKTFPVRGARDLLREALSNVVVNACLYNRKGGRVRIEAEKSPGGFLVRVADTGPGIDEDELPKVFDEFARGRNSRGVPGTGLGLALTRRVLELMGGGVEIQSEAGKGTTVSLRWPA
jgi:signal transduction histidine kinase